MLIVSSTSVEQCLSTIGTWTRAFDGVCSMRNAVAGSVWLEKNNEGWGSITILRCNSRKCL